MTALTKIPLHFFSLLHSIKQTFWLSRRVAAAARARGRVEGAAAAVAVAHGAHGRGVVRQRNLESPAGQKRLARKVCARLTEVMLVRDFVPSSQGYQ